MTGNTWLCLTLADYDNIIPAGTTAALYTCAPVPLLAGSRKVLLSVAL